MNYSKCLNYKCFFSKLQRKTFSSVTEDFPYKFGNRSQLYKLREDHKSLLVEEIKAGVLYIYKNYVSALADKDFDFLENNCEKRFADKVVGCLEKHRENLYVKKFDDIDEKIIISSLEIEAHQQINQDRDQNRHEKNKLNYRFFWYMQEKSVRWMEKKYSKLIPELEGVNRFYRTGKKAFLRIKANINTNYILTADPIEKVSPLEMEKHSIIIEAEMATAVEFYLSMIKDLKDNVPLEFDYPEFYIADFDDYMDGNPFL